MSDCLVLSRRRQFLSICCCLMLKGWTCTCLVTAGISQIKCEVQFEICEYVVVSSGEQTHGELDAFVGFGVF